MAHFCNVWFKSVNNSNNSKLNKKKLKRSQINNLTLYHRDLGIKEQTKAKASRRAEGRNSKLEQRENREQKNSIKEIKSCFFGKIHKIDNPTARLTKKKKM